MDFLGKTCPVCSKNFREGEDIVVCPKCGAPYHRECYKEKGKCIFADLHRSKKSWREVYDNEPEQTTDSHAEETVKCPFCGENNPKTALICRKCGNFLTENFKSAARYPEDDSDDEEKPFSLEDMPEDFRIAGQGSPFAIFIDPMGGVDKEENFEGVSGAELSKHVKANTTYYMPVFKKIKDSSQSRFNFAAFFFTGGWYLYRKQYVRGAVITILYFLLIAGNYIVTNWWSSPLWKEVYSAVSEAGITYPSYNDYLSWSFSHYSQAELCVMFLPYVFSLLSFVIKLICGLRANRSYYHHNLKRIRKIKEIQSSENVLKAISKDGGVNIPLAWSMIVSYLIVIMAFSMF